ncbi:MAG: hypothetical protein IK130_02535, partial [Oscillospiraceae bacterium]|nr:hypothetical protein [Oscillospiraceae bacterium]
RSENRPPVPLPPPPRPENRPPVPPPPPRPPILPPPLPSLIQPRKAVPAMADAELPPENEPPELPGDEQESTGQKRPYTGLITVHVSTARGARPIAGATVTVTRNVDGQDLLISLQTTDESGNIAPVTVPAPPPSEDQRRPQAFYYEISAQAAGFYREHSQDVPVFPFITSMQNFDLIPLPAGTDDPFPGGDLTFFNNMQQF